MRAGNTAPLVVLVPDPYASATRAEAERDRAELEAARARQLAVPQPAPINGAFTGRTGERDR